MRRQGLFSVLAAVLLLVAGCATSMGRHDVGALRATDFGPPVTVRIRALLDGGISREEAAKLLAEA